MFFTGKSNSFRPVPYIRKLIISFDIKVKVTTWIGHKTQKTWYRISKFNIVASDSDRDSTIQKFWVIIDLWSTIIKNFFSSYRWRIAGKANKNCILLPINLTNCTIDTKLIMLFWCTYVERKFYLGEKKPLQPIYFSVSNSTT